jgi:hippurate hydrolase
MSAILSVLEARADTFKALRRDIHQHPEIGFLEFRTSDLVAERLERWGYAVTRGLGGTGVVGQLKRGNGLRKLGLRADMDALSVKEETGLDYASTNGFMHACGHDLHMAAAIGAAHLLATHKAELSGTVVIWFQPGEEGHHGADVMIEEGFLELSGERPIAAYGLHVFTAMPIGAIACCCCRYR